MKWATEISESMLTLHLYKCLDLSTTCDGTDKCIVCVNSTHCPDSHHQLLASKPRPIHSSFCNETINNNTVYHGLLFEQWQMSSAECSHKDLSYIYEQTVINKIISICYSVFSLHVMQWVIRFPQHVEFHTYLFSEWWGQIRLIAALLSLLLGWVEKLIRLQLMHHLWYTKQWSTVKSLINMMSWSKNYCFLLLSVKLIKGCYVLLVDVSKPCSASVFSAGTVCTHQTKCVLTRVCSVIGHEWGSAESTLEK